MAVKGNEMVGAHGVEGDLLLDHHVVVIPLVGEGGDLGLGSLAETVEHLQIHLGDPLGRLLKIRVVEIKFEFAHDRRHVLSDLRDHLCLVSARD